MASGPTASWEIEVEKAETAINFLFRGSKFTADGDGSYKMRRQLLPGRKALTNLESMLKSGDMT